MPRTRKPVVGVMGGSDVGPDVERTAYALGRAVAERGWILLSGGRNCGVMAASARGAKSAGGFTVGILPGAGADDAAAEVDLAIVTGMGDARNAINVLSSDVVIALAGGPGTLSEVALALKRGKPVILLGFPMSATLEPYQRDGRLVVADSVADAVAKAAEALGGS